ncbi:MAG TPA: hypothetical protein VNZ57_00230 [Longimicrobiales bacterium]|nr:hypothetical protein [Longimicrobiales bacterium]
MIRIWHPDASIRRRTAIVALLWPAVALACSSSDAPSGPSDPKEQLTVTVNGRLERGMVIDVSATLDGGTVPGAVTWSSSPSNAVEFPAPGRALLKVSGAVQIRATTPDAAGQLTVQVSAPPVLVFDMRKNGNRDIYRASLDGQDLARLTNHVLDDLSPTAVGGTVVFTGYRPVQVAGDAVAVTIADLYSIPLAGGSATRMTVTGDAEQEPALSPNGQRLAFTRTGGDPATKVWVSGANGSGAGRATPAVGFAGSTETSPSWAPDNERLVYMSTHDGSANLYILNVAAGTITPLLTDAFSSFVEPAWSPDGKWIAFASNQDGPTNLYRVHVDTREVERLTNRAGTDGQPAWLPDGRIVFTSWFGNTTRLRWLDPADPQRVFDVPLDGDPQNPAGVF